MRVVESKTSGVKVQVANAHDHSIANDKSAVFKAHVLDRIHELIRDDKAPAFIITALKKEGFGADVPKLGQIRNLMNKSKQKAINPKPVITSACLPDCLSIHMFDWLSACLPICPYICRS